MCVWGGSGDTGHILQARSLTRGCLWAQVLSARYAEFLSTTGHPAKSPPLPVGSSGKKKLNMSDIKGPRAKASLMDAEVGDRQQDKRLSPGSGSAEFLRLTVNLKSRPYPGQPARHYPTQ